MLTEKKFTGIFTYPNGKEERHQAYFDNHLKTKFKLSNATHLAVYLNNKLLGTYTMEKQHKLKWTPQK